MKWFFVGWATFALSSCVAIDDIPIGEDGWVALPSPDRATVSDLGLGPTGTIYAASQAGVFVLEQDADAWRLTSPPDWAVLSVLVVTETTILVGSYRRGIRRSDDGGATWSLVGFEGNVYIDALARDESGRVFAAVAHSVENQPTGIFRSDDGGVTWVSSGLAGEHAYSVSVVGGDSIYAGTESGTYRSVDGGSSWTDVPGLPKSVPLSALVRAGRTLVAGFAEPRHRAPGAGAWVSTDEGATWRQTPGLPATTAVHSLVVVGERILAATGDVFGRGGAGVYSSTDFENWEPLALEGEWVRALIGAPDGQVYAGSVENGVFSGVANDQHWASRRVGLRNWNPTALALDRQDRLYALTARSLLRYEPTLSDWTEIPLPAEAAPPSPFSFATLSDGTLAIPGEGSVMLRMAGSPEWTRRDIRGARGPAIAIHAGRDHRLFATFPGQGVFESADAGATWSTVDTPVGARGVVVTSAGTLLSFGDGVSRKTGSGDWRPAHLDDMVVFEVIECGSDLFLGGAPAGVLRSRDDGRSWIPLMEGVREGAQQPGYIAVHSLVCLPDGGLIAATFSDGLHSFAEGAGWTHLSAGLPSQSLGDVVLAADGTVYATTAAGVHRRKFSRRQGFRY